MGLFAKLTGITGYGGSSTEKLKSALRTNSIETGNLSTGRHSTGCPTKVSISDKERENIKQELAKRGASTTESGGTTSSHNTTPWSFSATTETQEDHDDRRWPPGYPKDEDFI